MKTLTVIVTALVASGVAWMVLSAPRQSLGF